MIKKHPMYCSTGIEAQTNATSVQFNEDNNELFNCWIVKYISYYSC